MTRILAIIILAVAVSGCGREHKLQLGQFSGYVQAFQSRGTSFGKNVQVDDLVIEFGKMERDSEQGYCLLKAEETPVIRVNQSAWDRMSETERQLLLNHELGHCILGRKHKNDLMHPDEVPSSVMNSYAIDSDLYDSHREYYDGELFQGG